MDKAYERGWLHLLAAGAFALAALLGLAFAIAGPVALMRLLGWTALTFGLLGGALQVYSLRTFHPATYRFVERKVKGAMPAARHSMAPGSPVAHA